MKNQDLYTTPMFTNPHLSWGLGVRVNLLKHFVLIILFNVQSYVVNDSSNKCENGPGMHVLNDSSDGLEMY